MIGIAYTMQDRTSANIAEYIIKEHSFEENEKDVFTSQENEELRIYKTDSSLLDLEMLDSLKLDTIIFLSMHSSEAGIEALTTHSMGNWGNEARFGGKPKQLSFASPVEMLSILVNLSKIDMQMDKVYEATHHGPLLKTPSMFVEIGGSEEALLNKKTAAAVGNAVFESVSGSRDENTNYTKVAIGIGSNHYPKKFSELAVQKGYAFSHIMPRYAIKNQDDTYNTDVLEQTLTRTSQEPEIAVIEWKSLNADLRDHVTEELESIGIDYEKV